MAIKSVEDDSYVKSLLSAQWSEVKTSKALSMVANLVDIPKPAVAIRDNIPDAPEDFEADSFARQLN